MRISSPGDVVIVVLIFVGTPCQLPGQWQGYKSLNACNELTRWSPSNVTLLSGNEAGIKLMVPGRTYEDAFLPAT
ncbi:hypothetical protein EDC04DRAFT_2732778 [Pisolithus marmoratus]|nr:hypothetical protein EDC04DRAFT_2732778 [Pisolithus marmoratus]